MPFIMNAPGLNEHFAFVKKVTPKTSKTSSDTRGVCVWKLMEADRFKLLFPTHEVDKCVILVAADKKY